MNSGGTSGAAARWSAHPVASRLVRVAIFVLPFLTAMVVAYGLSLALPLATSGPGTALRWVAIIAASTLAMRVADRQARRLLPLSTLLELTLVFPDQAPSRFAIAMKTGTTRQLAARIEEARNGRPDETPAEAAERLIELVGLLSHHDRLTRGHSERVRAYTHLIGTELGLNETELDKIRWAGLLHDIGKTAIAAEILNKPGKLTDAEYEIVKTHPTEGRELVAPLADWLGDSLRAVWEHHEKFDGSGYPRGLAGTDISMAARIVAVADVYDVMTSARSYKAPMPAAEAREELARCAGTHFDPVVVRAFFSISLGRLRLMAGPAAWLAQLAFFEPTGVVHASSGTGSAGATGTAATATASTGAASTGLAATTAVSGSVAGGAAAATAAAGGATVLSVVSTTAAVTLGVASGAVGISAADNDREPIDSFRTAQVVEAQAVGQLSDPSSTVAIVDDDGVRLAPMGKLSKGGTAKSGTDPFARAQTRASDAGSAGGGADGAGGSGGGAAERAGGPDTDDPSGARPDEPAAAAAGAPGRDGDDRSETGDDETGDDGNGNNGNGNNGNGDGGNGDGGNGNGDDETRDGETGDDDGDDRDDEERNDGDRNDDGERPVTPAATVPTGTAPGGQAPPSTPPSGTTPAATIPTGNIPTGTVPTGTTPAGTTPAATAPAGTTPAGTTPAATAPGGTAPGPAAREADAAEPQPTTPDRSGRPESSRLYLESPGGESTASASYGLSPDAPPDRALANLDTDRDAAPGLLIRRGAAGPTGTDASRVAVFTRASLVSVNASSDATVRLHVAARDFARADVHVAVVLQRCGTLSGCTTIATADELVRNANRWAQVDLDLGELAGSLGIGDRLELRVAALDSGEADMWLAFGTADHAGFIEFTS